MADAPRVFLSYSHDSAEHADRVLALANALCDGGIDVILDRYVHPAPAEGWPRWMDRNLDEAQFVLMVCTETYRRRAQGLEEPGKGLGVDFEGNLIYNQIYHRIQNVQPRGWRFIPILLPGSEPAHIPGPVRGYSYYRLATFDLIDPGFEALYRHLTDQPATPQPGPNPIQILPPKPRPQAVPGPLPPSGGPWWNVPHPRNLNFTGREAILAQIEAALAAGTPAALTQAIAGLGGVGKTQTAVEYAYRHRDQYRAVLWVQADPGWVRPDPGTNLVSSYHELAEVLGLPVKKDARDRDEKDAHDRDEVVAAVRRWLGREPGYLLILDNADDPALVKPYLPPDPRGHVLLTSRAHNFNVLGIRRPIDLPVLEPEEALAFLQRRTDREEALDPAERDAARTLAEELGYLPLALEQAAAYMVEHDETFAVYLAAYCTLRLKLLDEMGPVTGNYPETVRTTWKRSFDAVAADSPASIALLRLSAFLAPDAIPYELILEGASELGKPLAPALASPPGGDHALNKLLPPLARYEPILEGASELGEPLAPALALNKLLTPLTHHSLVRRDREARTYSVHRLVQAVLLDELTWFDPRLMSSVSDVSSIPTSGKNLVIVADVKGVLHFRTFDGDGRVVVDTDETSLTTQAGPIADLKRQLESLWSPHELTSSEKDRIIAAVTSIVGHAQLTDATYRDFAERAIKALNRTFPDVEYANWPRCERLVPHALAVWGWIECFDMSEEPLLVPAAAQLLNQAGYYLYLRARYAEAERLHRRALAIWEALGPDNPDTATSLNNLGVLLRFRGRFAEAEPLLRRALAIREAALGPNDPDNDPYTAISLNNLALLLQAQGRYGEAEPLYRRALAIREMALPRDHPDTVYTLNDLAGLLREQGRPGEAEQLLRQALALRKQALGPDHPDTATSLNSLGVLLRFRGCYCGEAEQLLRRALKIREAALGPDHPDIAQSLNDLAEVLRAQGRYGKAAPLHRRALKIREAALGPDHPDIAQSLNNLAEVLRALDRPGEAEPLLRRALKIRKAALGHDHQKTAYTRSNLAEVLWAQGRPGRAERLHRGALGIFKARLGPEHPYTVCCQERLDKHLSRLNQAAMTIASSANPSGSGQLVTFTATVSVVPPGIGTPTGTVTFSVDGTPQSPVPLTVINGVDQATFTTAPLSAGTYTITAVYGGDSNFTTSTSPPFCQKVK